VADGTRRRAIADESESADVAQVRAMIKWAGLWLLMGVGLIVWLWRAVARAPFGDE